jgi:sulfite exporter TauE/SafE/copper chaperone CopZ
MTCASCETRVSKALGRVPGVVKVKVSAVRGTAAIWSHRPLAAEPLARAVEQAGYQVGAAALPWVSRERRIWADALVAAVVVGGLILAWRASGAGDLAGGLTGRLSAGSLVFVLVLGLVASVSTCMALVGGLVMSISASWAKSHPEAVGRRLVRPQIWFNLGRIVGFGVLGAGLGAVGSVFQLSGWARGLLLVALSLVMLALGLRLTGLSPKAARFTIAWPAGLSRRLDSASAPWLIGAGSFFLPCGFTQAVQVYALSQASPVRAGVVMALFALGTTPGLMAVGLAGAAGGGRRGERLFHGLGVVVMALALVNLSGAANLLLPDLGAGNGPTVSQRSDNVVDVDGVQVLTTVQDGSGYRPAQAVVYAGRPVRWEITSNSLSCASSMNLEAMGLGQVTLARGENRLAFTPAQPGTLWYACSMGMFRARIDVIEPPPEPEKP